MTTKDNEPKPVAWIEHGSDEVPSIVVWERGAVGHYTPLYTSPPASKPWVGLTNNELQPICDEYRILFGGWVEDFARAIEAKLKEKNGY